MSLRVVIDTNVVVSGLLKAEGLEDQVLKLAVHRRLQACVSVPILAEYERVLLYPKLAIAPQLVADFLRHFRAAALLVAPTIRLAACSHEPDNRFLECAQAAQADFLVTGNKRHFPRRWKQTRIMAARELLLNIPSSLP